MNTTQSNADRSGVTNALKRHFLPVFLGIAIPAIALTFLPTTSEARPNSYGHCNDSHRKIIGHCSRCNTPVYSHYQVIGRQSCGAPRYGWVNQPHQCSRHSSHRGHGHSAHQGHSSRHSGHSNHYASRSRSGHSSQFNFYDFVRRFR